METIKIRSQPELDALPNSFDEPVDIRVIGSIEAIGRTPKNAMIAICGNARVGWIGDNARVDWISGDARVGIVNGFATVHFREGRISLRSGSSSSSRSGSRSRSGSGSV